MSDLRWDDLHLFLVLHRTSSLGRAAQVLGLNQSTTSRRLTTLEEAVGTLLFERTPHGLVPTPAAQRMLPAAERAEAAAHDALRSLDGIGPAIEGDVRLAVSEGLAFYGLAPLAPRLRARHPGIVLSLVVSNALADLSRREADLAMRWVRPDQGDYVAKRVFVDRYALFAAETFRGDELVGWDATHAHLREAQWEAASGRPVVVRAGSLTTRVALSQAGVGAVLLPAAFGALLPDLRRVDAEVDMDIEGWLVTHGFLRDVPRIRAVWEFVEEVFEELERLRR